MAKNTQGWKMPTGKEALEALQAAKPMEQVYEENFAKAVAETTKQILQQNQKQKAAVQTAAKETIIITTKKTIAIFLSCILFLSYRKSGIHCAFYS